jgi:tetratricopeptide (TPR) repeat protein
LNLYTTLICQDAAFYLSTAHSSLFDERRAGRLAMPQERVTGKKPQKTGEALLKARFDEATAAHRQGKLIEAERIYADIARKKPDHFDALYRLGIIAAQTRRTQEAVDLFRKAIALNQGVAGVHRNLGHALLEIGRPNDALLSYQRAIALDPGDAESHNGCGLALHESERFEEAINCYDKAIALSPNFAQAHYHRGLALQTLERFNASLECYDRAIALEPNFVEAYSNRGRVLRRLERPADALVSYDRMIALRPQNAEGYLNRGNTLQELGRLDEALASFDKAIAISPDFAEAYSNRGNALRKLKRADEALISFDKSIALKPDSAEVHANRGNALQELGRLNEALISFDKAIALKPDSADLYINRGKALLELNRDSEALASFDKAIALKLDLPLAHWNRAHSLLRAGDFDQGWKEYEWRWRVHPSWVRSQDFPQSLLWLGERPIEGKTIVLYAEQGFGDTIQFVRYVPLVAALGAKVILEVHPELKMLLSGVQGAGKVIGRGEALPPFDWHCPLASLPLAFKTRLKTIPAATPYLFAPEERVAFWATQLPKSDLLRIGIVWSGNPEFPDDNTRSIGLAPLVPMLSTPGFQFVSIQKDLRVGDEEILRDHPQVLHLGDELADFSDTAAIMSLLDLIVSSDTAPVHLAGALDRPVWILLQHSPDWRWMVERDDNPWYPAARLFRQTIAGDWAGVVGRVIAALNSGQFRRAFECPRPSVQARNDGRHAAPC